MGLFDRISRIVRGNINSMVDNAEDPEKVLDQAVIDMQEQLVQLRTAVAKTIAEQKRTEQQFNQNQSEADKWQQRAQLALTKGDETLAREALVRKKQYAETAGTLEVQLKTQKSQVQTLKNNLIALESKISEAKTKKNMLKARSKAAKANQELQSTLSGINTSGAMSAFERMEEKVLQMEAESQSITELGGTGLDRQFAELEASSGVDDELAAMKAQISGSSPAREALPSAKEEEQKPEETSSFESKSEVDSELERLRSQLKKM
ncbi:MAG: PspA/IM30 family protein [Prochloraceae cyanobacterium]